MREADEIFEHEIFVIFLLGSCLVIAENVSPVNAHLFHKFAELNTVNLLMIGQNNITGEKDEIRLFCFNVLCKHKKRLVYELFIIAKVKVGRYKDFKRLVDDSAVCVTFGYECRIDRFLDNSDICTDKFRLNIK